MAFFFEITSTIFHVSLWISKSTNDDDDDDDDVFKLSDTETRFSAESGTPQTRRYEKLWGVLREMIQFFLLDPKMIFSSTYTVTRKCMVFIPVIIHLHKTINVVDIGSHIYM